MLIQTHLHLAEKKLEKIVEPYPVYQKLVVSGSCVERYIYEKPYIVGMPRLMRYKRFISVKKAVQMVVREDNVRRARQKIRRLINSNPDMTKFMTLTFNDGTVDLIKANVRFNIFIKRLKRLFPDLKYLAVPEFQKKSGQVHYHLLVNIKEYLSNDDLADNIWQNGFAWVRNTYNVDNLGAYISKYLSKEIFDPRYFRKKKFFYSLNLLKPIIIDKIEDVKEFLFINMFDYLSPVFDFSFLTDFLGKVYYKRYLIDTLKVGT